MNRFHLLAVMLPLLLAASPAAGAHRIALVVGNNAPANDSLAPLKYADDDAFRYARFFAAAGHDVHLLARADAESAPLYPEMEARAPTRDNVLAAMDDVVAEAQNRAADGTEVVLFFVFSGHGNYDAEGRGYLHLEDGRLTTRDLFYHLISRSDSFRLVLLLDSCNASFLVQSRGAAERRPAGEPTLELERYDNVGLILSSSSTGEVKEWGRYVGGIFSHQVRSGLAGVADADGDERITFQELASFVEAANRSVENPALRLTPYIRPPLAAPELPLVDLDAAAFARTVRFDSQAAQRVTVYDDDLLRYADFHLAAGHEATLALPAGGTWYVQTGGDREYVVGPDVAGRVTLADLPAHTGEAMQSRGTDSYLLERLFAVPYDRSFAQAYLSGPYQQGLVFERQVERPWYENSWAWTSVGAGVALLGAGGYFLHEARAAHDAAVASPWASQRAAHNDRIDLYNDLTIAATVVGSAAVVGGVVLFFVDRPTRGKRVAPEVGPGLQLLPSPTGAMLEGRF